MTYNQMPVTITLDHIDVANLLIACYTAGLEAGETTSKGVTGKWGALHDKLLAALDAYDAKYLPLYLENL